MRGEREKPVGSVNVRAIFARREMEIGALRNIVILIVAFLLVSLAGCQSPAMTPEQRALVLQYRLADACERVGFLLTLLAPQRPSMDAATEATITGLRDLTRPLCTQPVPPADAEDALSVVQQAVIDLDAILSGEDA